MLVKCAAPECDKMVQISGFEHLKNSFDSLFHGGDFADFQFCPEHKERITGGKFNDGDPSTNPDLNK